MHFTECHSNSMVLPELSVNCCALLCYVYLGSNDYLVQSLSFPKCHKMCM